MADTTTDRPHLSGEDLDRIRARLMARANLGIDPNTPSFLDAIPGSIYGDLEGPSALSHDELYDFGDVVARACIPIDSYGEWLDDWAESLGLARRDSAPAGGTVTIAGTPGTIIPPNQIATTTAPINSDAIAFTLPVGGGVIGVGGTVTFNAVAVLNGRASNVPTNTVTLLEPGIDGVTSVTNTAPMSSGADVESDEQLQDRVLQSLAGNFGGGTVDDYVRWGLSRPGVGGVTVKPFARGPGTVDVYIVDVDHNPSSPASVTDLQNFLDPVPAQGLGEAPIGHDVLVRTPALTAVTFSATGIVHAVGYSLDGDAGTRSTRAPVTSSVMNYVNGLDVAADVIHDQSIAAVVDVPGVIKIGGALQINGAPTDFGIADGFVASLSEDDITLS
jgi:uncharacterized phage protein gp47/JayE